MLRIEHLKKAFDTSTPIRDISAVIRDGDVISIIGPSGTGKSTLLRCINRLTEPTEGRIFLDNVEITDKKCNLALIRRKIGFVFQSFNLYEHMTVIENIMYAQVRLLKKSRQEAYDTGMALLERVGLANQALKYSRMLSGGQRQRVAIARTLALDPKVILFDEPTSALDPMMVGEVLSLIRDLAGQGITMLIVTHEMDFARKVSNRVFYLDEGILYEDGSPEQIFEHPTREKTRRFINRLSVMEMDVTQDFNFYQTVSDIEAFVARHGLSRKHQYRAESVFEEMAMNILLPKLGSSDRIHAELEYSGKNEGLLWRFRYPSALEKESDELPWKILRGATSEIRTEADAEGEYAWKTECVL